MTIEDLEALIEAGTETQNIDFKGDCPWSPNSFARDILAMTNVQDGGRIIIGVKEKNDGSYVKEGVSDDNKSSYKRDNMMDQLAKYADPHLSFSIDFLTDEDKLSYVVINVAPFKEVPVICKSDGSDLQAGVIYYRNRDKKPESARISNSYDMRDVIERSAIKLMQRAKRIGYETSDMELSVKKSLADERGNL